MRRAPERLIRIGLEADKRRELGELRRLTDQAFDLRETPYLRDAITAIEDWWQARSTRAVEREEEQLALLLRVLDSTDPDRIMRRRRAA
jgi:hypothetical protein